MLFRGWDGFKLSVYNGKEKFKIGKEKLKFVEMIQIVLLMNCYQLNVLCEIIFWFVCGEEKVDKKGERERKDKNLRIFVLIFYLNKGN